MRRSVGEIWTSSSFLIRSRPNSSSASRIWTPDARLMPRSQSALETGSGLNVSGSAIVALRLKHLSRLQRVAQALVVYHGSLVDHADPVIGGVGERLPALP